LDALLEEGNHIARLHRALLPLEDVDFGAGGFGARIEPYRSQVKAGDSLGMTAIVLNPFARDAEVSGSLVVPRGWQCVPQDLHRSVEGRGATALEFLVRPSASAVRRARLAIDMTVDGVRFGQQAEALVDVVVG
jgi:hypothetical protein